MDRTIHECAVDLVEIFEDLLDDKDMSIPCENWSEEAERRSTPNTAAVYGSEYGDLIDKIEARLEMLKEDLK